ncbi:MAG: type II secretion system F family protein [Candidatus Aenigmatarchaeota archaeon]|nr:MAG: type II secretion system F family protein [Candidatus Aenigmarchaeota archaeon]
MDVLTSYKKLAYGFFGPLIESHIANFESLKPDLQKANIDMSVREYVSVALMSTLLLFVVELPLIAFIFSFISGFTLMAQILFSITVAVALSGAIFALFFFYPSMVVSRRKRDIDYTLPFATLYMATTAGSNAPPQTMFRVLAEFGEFGEVSREASKIVRNMDVFGMDLVEAIRRTIEKSPSDDFKELMWGMITTITTGGNMAQYLHERAKAYMQDYRRRLDEFSDRLSTMLEIYLTLIIVGSIFFIVLTAIMSAFGVGGGLIELIVVLQFLVIFVGLPLISLGFIYVLKGVSPKRA